MAYTFGQVTSTMAYKGHTIETTESPMQVVYFVVDGDREHAYWSIADAKRAINGKQTISLPVDVRSWFRYSLTGPGHRPTIKRDMETSIHYTSGNCVTKVTPTMQALGDQPFRCEVFKHTKSEFIRENFVIEAGSRWEAAKRAQEMFNEKHGPDVLILDEIIAPRRIA